MTTFSALTHRLLPLMLCAPVLLPSQTPAPTAPPAPAASPAPAAPPTLTDEQTANIMKQLEQIEAQITKGRGDILGTALAKFRAAAASSKDALALYLDCYKLEHFDRRDLKMTDFQAWRDANEASLKDEDFLTGLQLQLEYLVMSIQAQEVKETKELGPLVVGLQAFLPKAIAAVQETIKHTASGAIEPKNQGGNGARPGGNRSAGGGRQGGGGGFAGGGQLGNMLRQSVKSSEFSVAYLLEDYLARADWSYSPLDIASIYSQVIFPYYLDQKPTEIGAQWDSRINAELALRKITQSESEYAVFFRERQPELAWEKASYMLANNVNPIMALADMLKVIRENPNHASAQSWLKELRRAVNSAQPGGAPSPGSAPATTATPAAGS